MGCLFCVGAYYPDFTIVGKPRHQPRRMTNNLFPKKAAIAYSIVAIVFFMKYFAQLRVPCFDTHGILVVPHKKYM